MGNSITTITVLCNNGLGGRLEQWFHCLTNLEVSSRYVATHRNPLTSLGALSTESSEEILNAVLT